MEVIYEFTMEYSLPLALTLNFVDRQNTLLAKSNKKYKQECTALRELNHFMEVQNNNNLALIRRLQRQLRLARSRITVQDRLIEQLGQDIDGLREGWIPRRRRRIQEEPETEVSETESEVLVDTDDDVDI